MFLEACLQLFATFLDVNLQLFAMFLEACLQLFATFSDANLQLFAI